ncbi:hypothetical protein ABY58_07610 [Edwardsiella ictaluri]|nr:hypothetical protein ABY58_07610 [Edwardsiella ictaluri]
METIQASAVIPPSNSGADGQKANARSAQHRADGPGIGDRVIDMQAKVDPIMQNMEKWRRRRRR